MFLRRRAGACGSGAPTWRRSRSACRDFGRRKSGGAACLAESLGAKTESLQHAGALVATVHSLVLAPMGPIACPSTCRHCSCVLPRALFGCAPKRRPVSWIASIRGAQAPCCRLAWSTHHRREPCLAGCEQQRHVGPGASNATCVSPSRCIVAKPTSGYARPRKGLCAEGDLAWHGQPRAAMRAHRLCDRDRRVRQARGRESGP